MKYSKPAKTLFCLTVQLILSARTESLYRAQRNFEHIGRTKCLLHKVDHSIQQQALVVRRARRKFTIL